jgi:predicted DNA-binding transcriptional regulator YafY
MSRTARLLEIMIKVQARPRFTVQQMAAEFGVSRRTMLRDLQALSSMGVPLFATPGPHGGYGLLPSRRLLPLSLTIDEAVGVLLSYEAFLEYAQSPFSAQSLSAITRLRSALPPDVVRELDRIRRHVAVIERPRNYEAPLLADILRAALDGAHLRVVYDSQAGVGERVIFPFGLYASAGFWYCACFDYRRGMNLSLRADRFASIERVEGLERPPHIPVAQWLRVVESDDGHQLPLRARVTVRGLKRFELQSLFGRVQPDEEGGGVVVAGIPASEVDWYARQLLALGGDLVVESPPELIEALRQQAQEILRLYPENHHLAE